MRDPDKPQQIIDAAVRVFARGVLGQRGYRLAATAPTVADLFLPGIAANR
jgi:hypothetical protein